MLREWDCGDGKNKCFGVAGVTIWPPLAAIKIDLGKPRIPEGLSIHYTALYSAVQHHLTDGEGQNCAKLFDQWSRSTF